MNEKDLPKPEDIQKEFEDFVKKRFGGQVKIISQELPFGNKQKAQEPLIEKDEPISIGHFDLKPKDVKTHLDRFVIGQDEAKKALSIAVCDHYNQVRNHMKDPQHPSHENYTKQNVLILGPTGVGKTYLVRQIAKLVGVPFVKADATRFSETGYIGANVDDLIRDLVSQADGNLQKAQYGIIYLDEADKLATRGQTPGRDVSGRGVQMGLLKLMEETEVDLRASHDPASQMQAFMEMQQKGKIEKHSLSTRHILFIVSGAFGGFSEIIAKRLQSKQIGFGSSKATDSETDHLQDMTTQDFIDYGFEPEFIGRLPVRVACKELDESALFSILKTSEGSVVHQYIQSFNSYGIELSFTEAALHLIAAKTVEEKTGARGLLTILEKALRDFKYYLPSTNALRLEVDVDLVQNPKDTLERLLKTVQEDQRTEIKLIKKFEKSFESKHGMKILFDDSAVQYLIRRSREDEIAADELCESILLSFEYGLNLVGQNTGRTEFILSEEVLMHPRQSLEKMVKESYNVLEEKTTLQ
jgi:endopeptidase Clp ATP-binding regulatory subunit ClpX